MRLVVRWDPHTSTRVATRYSVEGVCTRGVAGQTCCAPCSKKQREAAVYLVLDALSQDTHFPLRLARLPLHSLLLGKTLSNGA